MKKSTQGIIGLTLIIGGGIALFFSGRAAIAYIIDATYAITTPQAILIGSIIIAISNKRKGKQS